MPILGIAFLHWSPWALLIVYYVDTMVPFAALIAVEGRNTDGSRMNPLKTLALICIFGTLFGGPILAFGWKDLSFEWPVAAAALVQAFIAGAAFVRDERWAHQRQDRELGEKERDEITQEVSAHFAAPLIRWFIVFGTFMVFGPWPIVVVIAYLAVTVYFEVRPPGSASKG